MDEKHSMKVFKDRILWQVFGSRETRMNCGGSFTAGNFTDFTIQLTYQSD